MTEKQKQFADEYLKDFDEKRACRAVYKSLKGEEAILVNAQKLLANNEVQAYIKRNNDNATANKDEVLEYLTSVLRGESKSEIVVIENQGDFTSEATKLKKTPDEKERLKAAELLGKSYGMFTNRIQLDSNSLVEIVDNIPEDV